MLTYILLNFLVLKVLQKVNVHLLNPYLIKLILLLLLQQGSSGCCMLCFQVVFLIQICLRLFLHSFYLMFFCKSHFKRFVLQASIDILSGCKLSKKKLGAQVNVRLSIVHYLFSISCMYSFSPILFSFVKILYFIGYQVHKNSQTFWVFFNFLMTCFQSSIYHKETS